MEPETSAPALAERLALTDDDYRALGAFRQALRRFLAVSEAGAKLAGLTPQQHQALLAIRAHDGDQAISIGQLAASLLIRNHSAVGLVDRLNRRGLLRRFPSPRDGRRVLLELTPAGADVLETISATNLAHLKANVSDFDALLRSLDGMDLPPAPEPPELELPELELPELELPELDPGASGLEAPN